jgi:uncharacterized integral membrane protein (TIGR00697 family)
MRNQVTDNPDEKQKTGSFILVVFTGLLITFYLTANLLAVKVVTIGGVTVSDAGTITFPFTYVIGDVMTEIWGFRTTRKVIFLAFFCQIIMVLCTLAGTLFASPDSADIFADAYDKIFTWTPRIAGASLAAFLFGELLNAYGMVKIKQWTKGKFLWMRTFGSSVVGYFFDTVLFATLAFAGVVTARELLSMIFIQYLIKLAIEAFIGTPCAYACVHILRRRL